MMDKVYIEKVNESYIRPVCSDAFRRELSDHFTFVVPNHQYTPSFKFGAWDGKIRLLNSNGTIYAGLIGNLVDYCTRHSVECTIDPKLNQNEFSLVEAQQFVDSLDLKYAPREHQLQAFVTAVRNNRALLISPTASGKSLIIMLLCKYYQGRKLIVVPTINLVNQLSDDMSNYDLTGDISSKIFKIKAGVPKDNIQSEIVVSTWQSICKLPKSWFDQFDVVIGDEAHRFAAKSLVRIMTNLPDCKYRFGLTGTLDDSHINELVLTGLFGPKKVITTTKEMIDKGYNAALKIKAILLAYPPGERKSVCKASYNDEKAWLFANPKRNNFIVNLALSLKGNTLVLFNRNEGHGLPLFETIKAKSERPCYLVYGKIDGDDREDIRKIVNSHTSSITVASAGTFSTGVDIPNLNNVILAFPTKARVTILQSIGRSLRISDTKTCCTVYDIADDLSSKKWQNTTLKHYVQRVKIYISEEFEFKQYNVEIK